MLLDLDTSLYLWTGWWEGDLDARGSVWGRHGAERIAALTTALHYWDIRGKSPRDVHVVCAGLEPPQFKAAFSVWEQSSPLVEAARKFNLCVSFHKFNQLWSWCWCLVFPNSIKYLCNYNKDILAFLYKLAISLSMLTGRPCSGWDEIGSRRTSRTDTDIPRIRIDHVATTRWSRPYQIGRVFGRPRLWGDYDYWIVDAKWTHRLPGAIGNLLQG